MTFVMNQYSMTSFLWNYYTKFGVLMLMSFMRFWNL